MKIKSLDDFKIYLTQIDKKEQTIYAYISQISRLLKYYDGKDLTDITEDDITDYLDTLSKSYSVSSVQLALYSYRLFWRFLIEQGICIENPANEVRVKQNRPDLPVALKETFKNMSLTEKKLVKSLRDECIIVLMSKTILRQEDLIKLNMNNIDMSKKKIHISEYSVVDITKDIEKTIYEYIVFLDNFSLPPESPMFMNFNGGRLTSQSIRAILKSLPNQDWKMKKPRNQIYNKDLKGQTFGSLKVISPTDDRKNGYVVWQCECTCGKVVYYSTDDLKQNQSCGCLLEKAQSKLHAQLDFVDGTCVQFLENRKHRSDNTSGFRGVYKNKNGKFKVKIGFKGTHKHIGTFDTFEMAVAARLKAEEDIYQPFLDEYYESINSNEPTFEEKIAYTLKRDHSEHKRYSDKETITLRK